MDTKINPKDAILNLPSNYIGKVQKELEKLFQEGKTSKKNYSTTHISNVKQGKVYNSDVMFALINVGSKEIEIRTKLGLEVNSHLK